MKGAELNNITATDAMITKSSSFGSGCRCFPFHFSKAVLVLLARDLLNTIGGTAAVNG